jgi:hypothetical protein
MKTLAVCYILCLSVSVCSAQSTLLSEGQAWKFRSTDYVGLSSGQWGSIGLVQTINGLYKGPWFVGLGAGLDNYRFRSIPLFLALTRDLPAFSKRSGLFVDLEGGINLPWYTLTLPAYEGITSSKFYPGLWGSASLGYKWKLSVHSRKALLFSAGYSMKKMRQDQTAAEVIIPCYYAGVCNTSQQTYVYEYLVRTLIFRIGLQF